MFKARCIECEIIAQKRQRFRNCRISKTAGFFLPESSETAGFKSPYIFSLLLQRDTARLIANMLALLNIFLFYAGPGPGRYALPSTVGFKSHDFTKYMKPAYSFGHRLDNSSKLLHFVQSFRWTILTILSCTIAIFCPMLLCWCSFEACR